MPSARTAHRLAGAKAAAATKAPKRSSPKSKSNKNASKETAEEMQLKHTVYEEGETKVNARNIEEQLRLDQQAQHHCSVALLKEGEDLSKYMAGPPPVLTITPDSSIGFMPADVGSVKAESETTLKEVLEDPEYSNGVVNISYEYDHGDGWEHEMIFLGKANPGIWKQMSLPEDLDVACIGGERHGPAEDSGGSGGWEESKELFKKPRSKDEDDRRGWYKNGGCLNGDPQELDPYKWSIFYVNDELKEMKV